MEVRKKLVNRKPRPQTMQKCCAAVQRYPQTQCRTCGKQLIWEQNKVEGPK